MSLPSTTHLPGNRCPACEAPLDAATHPTEDVTPKPGDLTMCLYCGEFFSFGAGLELRSLDGDALAESDLIEIQRARRAWKVWRESVVKDGEGTGP